MRTDEMLKALNQLGHVQMTQGLFAGEYMHRAWHINSYGAVYCCVDRKTGSKAIRFLYMTVRERMWMKCIDLQLNR